MKLKLLTLDKCVICGNLFYKNLKPSRHTKIKKYPVRRNNSKTCSKKCSRKLYYLSVKRRKLNNL